MGAGEFQARGSLKTLNSLWIESFPPRPLSSLYIVQSVGKEHRLKICHSGSRPACQVLSSLLHGQAYFITCYNSGLGLDPAILIQHQMVRGVEKEKGYIHFLTRFGETCGSRVDVAVEWGQ